MSTPNPLIGHRLLAVHLADDNEAIKFVTDQNARVGRCTQIIDLGVAP
jgi:hypothetical protein